MKPQPIKWYLRNGLFLLIGVVLLVLAFYGHNFQEIVNRLLKVNYWWILFGQLLLIVAHYVRSMRWKLLIEPMDYSPKTIHLFYGTMIGYFINMITPKLGDIARCFSVKQTDQVPASTLLGTLVVERAIDVLSLALILGGVFLFYFQELTNFFANNIGFPFKENLSYIINQWWGLVAVGVTLLILACLYLYTIRGRLQEHILFRKVMNSLQGILKGIRSIIHLRKGGQFIGHTLVMWGLYILSFYICFFAIKSTSNLSLGNAVLAQSFSGIAWAMPVQAGIGAFHWAVTQALILVDVNYTDALVYATVKHTTAVLLNLIVGGASMIVVLVKVGKSFRFRHIKAIFKKSNQN